MCSKRSQKISDSCGACLPKVISISLHRAGLHSRRRRLQVTERGDTLYRSRDMCFCSTGHPTACTISTTYSLRKQKRSSSSASLDEFQMNKNSATLILSLRRSFFLASVFASHIVLATETTVLFYEKGNYKDDLHVC